MRILLVEDDVVLADTINQILKKNKYIVDICFDGESAFDNALANIYDLILLDIMIPKMNGLTVLRELRNEKIETPIILLTAKSEIDDKITGLDYGADDYIAKPFNNEELLARIRARLRRKNETIETNLISFLDLKLDRKKLILYGENQSINLTLKEAELMGFLINKQNLVSEKETILGKVWGFNSDADYNHLEVYISFLRKKLLFLKSKVYIKTIRGVGYILKEDENV